MTPEQAKAELKYKLNETEPCRVPFDENNQPNDPEKWTGAWVNSTTSEVARELCAGCHVLEICLEYAILNDEKDFIYGGMTPQQRKDERARRLRVKKINARLAKESNSTDKAA